MSAAWPVVAAKVSRQASTGFGITVYDVDINRPARHQRDAETSDRNFTYYSSRVRSTYAVIVNVGHDSVISGRRRWRLTQAVVQVVAIVNDRHYPTQPTVDPSTTLVLPLLSCRVPSRIRRHWAADRSFCQRARQRRRNIHWHSTLLETNTVGRQQLLISTQKCNIVNAAYSTAAS